MVINQLCLSSVDETSGWLVHREMTALGTDTKQVILCERGRVVDFAVLEDIPKEVTFGKVAGSLVLSVTTQSGQGLVYAISTDGKLKMLKKWTDVRLLAFGDFRKNGRHSTLVVFRNVQNDAIFLVDDQITVKKHVFSTCPEQTVSKGLRDTLDATDLLVVRQQLILEDQSKKLVTRRAQLQKALSLLQQLHSSPEAPSGEDGHSAGIASGAVVIFLCTLIPWQELFGANCASTLYCTFVTRLMVYFTYVSAPRTSSSFTFRHTCTVIGYWKKH
jgi:hypothetical protein